MAVITKFSGYYLEPDNVSMEFVEGYIQYLFDEYSDGEVRHLRQECVKFDWDSKYNDMLYDDCDLAMYESFFEPKPTATFDRPIPVAGQKYRHFKIGKIVEIIAVGRNSENPMHWEVIYNCSNGVWCRPLDMFMSEVDRKRYPEATQKYRFELVE